MVNNKLTYGHEKSADDAYLCSEALGKPKIPDKYIHAIAQT